MPVKVQVPVPSFCGMLGEQCLENVVVWQMLSSNVSIYDGLQHCSMPGLGESSSLSADWARDWVPTFACVLDSPWEKTHTHWCSGSSHDSEPGFFSSSSECKSAVYCVHHNLIRSPECGDYLPSVGSRPREIVNAERNVVIASRRVYEFVSISWAYLSSGKQKKAGCHGRFQGALEMGFSYFVFLLLFPSA